MIDVKIPFSQLASITSFLKKIIHCAVHFKLIHCCMSIKLGGNISDQQNNTMLYQSKHYSVGLNSIMK